MRSLLPAWAYRAPAALLRLGLGLAVPLLILLFVWRVRASLDHLDPAAPALVWLRLCEALVSQAPLALLALALLALASDHAPRCCRRFPRWLRSLALSVAIGYLLLIPLYATALWSRSQAESEALQQDLRHSITRLQQSRSAVVSACSPRELDRILAALPAGSLPLLRNGSNLDQRRTTALAVFDQTHRRLDRRLQGIGRRLVLRHLGAVSFFSLACLALAALFQRCSQLALPIGRQRPSPAEGRSVASQLSDAEALASAVVSPSASLSASQPAASSGQEPQVQPASLLCRAPGQDSCRSRAHDSSP